MYWPNRRRPGDAVIMLSGVAGIVACAFAIGLMSESVSVPMQVLSSVVVAYVSGRLTYLLTVDARISARKAYYLRRDYRRLRAWLKEGRE